MNDPLGIVSQLGSVGHQRAPNPIAPSGKPAGTDFKVLLQNQIDTVNQLQKDATVAVEDLAAGRRDDVESVILATQKADLAFRMLLQVRNKVVDAYEELKQIRV